MDAIVPWCRYHVRVGMNPSPAFSQPSPNTGGVIFNFAYTFVSDCHRRTAVPPPPCTCLHVTPLPNRALRRADLWSFIQVILWVIVAIVR
jgi:hypothetical protein